MKKIMIFSLALIALAFVASASAVQLFDFDGQAILPANVGEDAEMYGRIVNGSAVATPIPLDFDNFEYTVVVTGLTMDSIGASSTFSNGTVVIYEDAGTASDWANPATFSDGVAILSGDMPWFAREMVSTYTGSGLGEVNWTGGTRLNDLAPEDQTGWPFLTVINRFGSFVEPGYSELWDGKIEPTDDVVANETDSWSGLKASYR